MQHTLQLALLAAFALSPWAPVASARPQGGVDLLVEAFGGVAFGDTVAEVTAKLEGLGDELVRHDVEPPSLPLARATQTHLIALGLSTAGVDEVAFTFGDDALVLVEARGGAVDGLLIAFEDQEPSKIQGYRAWFSAGVVAHDERDAVWILGPAALHVNLFQWENPDLPSVAGPQATYARSAAVPALLEFGASLETLLPRIEQAASCWDRLEIRPPFLPTRPQTQLQLDCFGVVYAGFPRKIEAIFGDDRLQMAWILTGAPEQERVRRELVRAFGEPHFVSKQWEAFDDWRVALRKDKPEVLLLADELVPLYRPEIESSADPQPAGANDPKDESSR